MSRSPGTLGLATWALRRPGAAVRMVRSRGLWVALAVSAGLPRDLRRAAVALPGAVAGAALRHRGDHPIAAPVRMLALHEAGRDDDAMAVATTLRGDASPRTVARLARVALALGWPDIADGLLERLPPPEDVLSDPFGALRGETDLGMGRYSLAMARLEAATKRDPGDRASRRLAADARGELALLDPSWRPAIPAARPMPAASRTPGRIVHLLTNSLPYRQAGYTVRAQQVARCQLAVGLDPRMVTRAGFPGSDGALGAPDRDVIDGVAYERIRPGLEPGLPIDVIAGSTADGLLDHVDRLRPSALHPASNYVNAQVALGLGERLGLPVVYEVRGFLEETWLARMGTTTLDDDRYHRAKDVETACMRRADAVVTLSETMRADILARGGLDPDRVVVIPNAVDVDRFVPGPRDAGLAREHGIGPEETVVGYISSLTAYEGIETLIEAVARLRRRGRAVRLLLVGDGVQRQSLEAAAAAAGVAADHGVIFTGEVPHSEIERYYRTIDVFVVPRTADRVSQLVTPLKPYEAMAMERAVVVSAVDALLEIVRDGETGRVFPAGDDAALADVIEALVDDPAQRRRLGAAARAWVAADRTWAGNGARYLELYQRLGVA